MADQVRPKLTPRPEPTSEIGHCRTCAREPVEEYDRRPDSLFLDVDRHTFCIDLA